jgi:hypothetical protein
MRVKWLPPRVKLIRVVRASASRVMHGLGPGIHEAKASVFVIVIPAKAGIQTPLHLPLDSGSRVPRVRNDIAANADYLRRGAKDGRGAGTSLRGAQRRSNPGASAAIIEPFAPGLLRSAPNDYRELLRLSIHVIRRR